MGLFNNREIATGCWLCVLLIWMASNTSIRASSSNVLQAFFRFKILVPILIMLLYVILIVSFLAAINIWNFSLFKDTIIWFFFFAIATMMRSVISYDEPQKLFFTLMTDNLKLVIFLEFLVNTYTFSLLIELILIPITTLILSIGAIVDSGEKFSSLKRLIIQIQLIFVLIALIIVVSRAIADFNSLLTVDVVRSIILTPLLSILLLPLIYIFILVSKYEEVFMRINFGEPKAKRLRRYAYYQILMYVGFNLVLIHK